MALYGYTVVAGIIIWCGVAMGTRGRAGIFVRGGGYPKCPSYTKKKNQHLNRGFSVSAYGVLVAAEMLISLQL